MEQSEEIWKPVKGFEGLYEVSNKKRVRCFENGKEEIIADGTYYYIYLYREDTGRYRKFFISNLIKEAFQTK